MSDERREQALAVNRAATQRWADAMRAHATAPPDPGFPERLRTLADAARAKARAERVAAGAGVRWKANPPARHARPPYELRPGTGRDAYGSAELWQRFDQAVADYNEANATGDPRAGADTL